MSCTVSRNGDLIHKVYLQVELPSVDPTGGNFNWVENIGHVLIDEVSIEIGGQTINYQVVKSKYKSNMIWWWFASKNTVVIFATLLNFGEIQKDNPKPNVYLYM